MPARCWMGRLSSSRMRSATRTAPAASVRSSHSTTNSSPPKRATVSSGRTARLNRSAHYLQRDSLAPLEQWLPAGALYKLPRIPASANGVRCFGRLALFDHYRTVAGS